MLHDVMRRQLGDDRAQSQQVTVCMEVAKRAERVVMLSGTPSMSKPFDLFNQVSETALLVCGKPVMCGNSARDGRSWVERVGMALCRCCIG